MIYINQVNKTDCRLAIVLHNYGSKISLATLRKFIKTTTDETTALEIDESTGGLGVLTEEKLIKNLMALSSKTIIFIAHRLSIAQITNNITVIDNGKIVEQGSHEELLKNKSLYFKLMQTQ
ncbi:cysteine peptidase family C39 domain-containing protein [Limosilactobacillus reuteri]|uniref:cysteine peptidase family C39 domain-containing protein n=1 Tax=Limosilactobacillus reuteri TaxID=1598 RepID=UPI00298D136F|nr:cysteine peptidase family C39 domain-containing protein [Limosilactobacillus reuteri]